MQKKYYTLKQTWNKRQELESKACLRGIMSCKVCFNDNI